MARAIRKEEQIMRALKTAVLAVSLVAVWGCADVGPLFDWDPYFVRQQDVCVDRWYGYWDKPCPSPPPKAVAASGSLLDELYAANRENIDLKYRLSALERQLAAANQRATTPAASDELDALRHDNGNLRNQVADLSRQLAAANGRVADLERQLAQAKSVQPAASPAATLETARQGLIRALRPQIEKGDITVDLNNERLLIKLASSYLFGSGQAQLKPGGADALKKVGEVLKDYPEYQVAVEGHTDDRPLRSSLKKQFATNQELSEARAANAAKALAEGGLSGATTAGFADTKPVASNSTDAGRAKNRRVEIRVTR
jgi:chemotaxis protein MotB